MTSRISLGIAIAAAVITVLAVAVATLSWSSPLTQAFVVATVGGLITSPFFVYLGYYLSERENRKRADTAREITQAKAALWLVLLYNAIRLAADAVPRLPAEVTSPSTQLSFTTDSMISFASPRALVDAYADLPAELRQEAARPLQVAPELSALVRVAKERSEHITREPNDGPPSWLDKHRPWTIADAMDPEFVRLYQPLTAKRQELIESLDEVQSKLTELTMPLDPLAGRSRTES